MRSPHGTHGITPISHQIHVSYNNHHLYLKHPILMQVLNQPNKNPCVAHANIPILVHRNQTTIYIHILQVLKRVIK